MKCNRCGEEKPPEDFYRREKICKDCKEKLRKKKRGVKRVLITRYLGKQCVICGEKGTTSHEKFGKPHKDLLNTSFEEIKQNCKSGRFVKVCHSCHQEVHSLRERDIVDWDSAQHYVREFVKTNPPKTYYARLWKWERFIDVKLNKPVGQQLELPVEVETVKIKLELEQDRVTEENRLKFQQREVEDKKFNEEFGIPWRGELTKGNTPRPSRKKSPPLS